MKREEYSFRLRRELAQIRVSPELRERTLAALHESMQPTREEQRTTMKRKLTMTLIFILAVLMLSGVALAAAGHWGMLDFFHRFSDVTLPEDAAIHIQPGAEQYDLGAAAIVVQEIYYDGYVLCLTMDVIPRDANVLLLGATTSVEDSWYNLMGLPWDEWPEEPLSIREAYQAKGCTEAYSCSIGIWESVVSDSIAFRINEDGTLTCFLEYLFRDEQPSRDLDLRMSLVPYADIARQGGTAEYGRKIPAAGNAGGERESILR